MAKNNETSQIYSYVIEQQCKKSGSTAYGELRLKKPLDRLQSDYTAIQKKALEDGKTYTKVVNRRGRRYIEARRRGYGTIKRVLYSKEKLQALRTDEQHATEIEREHLSDVEIMQLLVRTLKKQSKEAWQYWRDFEAHIGIAKGVTKSINKGTETGDEHELTIYIDYAGAWKYDKTFNL